MGGNKLFLVENIHSTNKGFEDKIMVGIPYRNRVSVLLKINITQGVCLHRMIAAGGKGPLRKRNKEVSPCITDQILCLRVFMGTSRIDEPTVKKVVGTKSDKGCLLHTVFPFEDLFDRGF